MWHHRHSPTHTNALLFACTKHTTIHERNGEYVTSVMHSSNVEAIFIRISSPSAVPISSRGLSGGPGFSIHRLGHYICLRWRKFRYVARPLLPSFEQFSELSFSTQCKLQHASVCTCSSVPLRVFPNLVTLGLLAPFRLQFIDPAISPFLWTNTIAYLVCSRPAYQTQPTPRRNRRGIRPHFTSQPVRGTRVATIFLLPRIDPHLNSPMGPSSRIRPSKTFAARLFAGSMTWIYIHWAARKVSYYHSMHKL